MAEIPDYLEQLLPLDDAAQLALINEFKQQSSIEHPINLFQDLTLFLIRKQFHTTEAQLQATGQLETLNSFCEVYIRLLVILANQRGLLLTIIQDGFIRKLQMIMMSVHQERVLVRMLSVIHLATATGPFLQTYFKKIDKSELRARLRADRPSPTLSRLLLVSYAHEDKKERISAYESLIKTRMHINRIVVDHEQLYLSTLATYAATSLLVESVRNPEYMYSMVKKFDMSKIGSEFVELLGIILRIARQQRPPPQLANYTEAILTFQRVYVRYFFCTVGRKAFNFGELSASFSQIIQLSGDMWTRTIQLLAKLIFDFVDSSSLILVWEDRLSLVRLVVDKHRSLIRKPITASRDKLIGSFLLVLHQIFETWGTELLQEVQVEDQALMSNIQAQLVKTVFQPESNHRRLAIRCLGKLEYLNPDHWTSSEAFCSIIQQLQSDDPSFSLAAFKLLIRNCADISHTPQFAQATTKMMRDILVPTKKIIFYSHLAYIRDEDNEDKYNRACDDIFDEFLLLLNSLSENMMPTIRDCIFKMLDIPDQDTELLRPQRVTTVHLDELASNFLTQASLSPTTPTAASQSTQFQPAGLPPNCLLVQFVQNAIVMLCATCDQQVFRARKISSNLEILIKRINTPKATAMFECLKNRWKACEERDAKVERERQLKESQERRDLEEALQKRQQKVDKEQRERDEARQLELQEALRRQEEAKKKEDEEERQREQGETPMQLDQDAQLRTLQPHQEPDLTIESAPPLSEPDPPSSDSESSSFSSESESATTPKPAAKEEQLYTSILPNYNRRGEQCPETSIRETYMNAFGQEMMAFAQPADYRIEGEYREESTNNDERPPLVDLREKPPDGLKKSVKCRLNTLIISKHPEFKDTKQKIMDFMERAVIRVNRIRFDVCMFLNFHIVRLLNKKPSPIISRIDFETLRSVIRMVSSVSVEREELPSRRFFKQMLETKTIFDRYRHEEQIVDRDNITQMTGSLAKQMATEIQTHLHRNFFLLLRRFLHDPELSDAANLKNLRYVLTPYPKKEFNPNKGKADEHGNTINFIAPVVQEVDEENNDDDQDKIDDSEMSPEMRKLRWRVFNARRFYACDFAFDCRIRLMAEFLEKFEKHNIAVDTKSPAALNNKKVKLFNILPCKDNYEIGYVHMEAQALEVMIKHLVSKKFEKRSDPQPIRQEREAAPVQANQDQAATTVSKTGAFRAPKNPKTNKLLAQYFNINKMVNNDKWCFSSMYTDGKSASLLYDVIGNPTKSPTKAGVVNNFRTEFNESKTNDDDKTNIKIYAIDPGAKKILTIHRYSSKEMAKEQVVYSCAEYFHQTRVHATRVYFDQLTGDKHQTYIAFKGRPSFKTRSEVTFLKYLKYAYEKRLYRMFSICAESSQRNRRFSRYCRKKRYLDNLVKKFRGALVGIGNWHWHQNSVIRTERGPIKQIKTHLLRNQIQMIEVDEFRTSLWCSSCGKKVLQAKYESRDPDQRQPRYRSVLHCPDCKRFINRDINGARNIFKCLVATLFGNARPTYLQRPPRTPAKRRLDSSESSKKKQKL